MDNLQGIEREPSTEEDLTKGEGRLKLFARAFQANPDALAITRRADGHILEVNENWEKLFGYSREEAVGQTPLGLGLYVNPSDRQRAFDLIDRQGFLHNFELDVQTRTGQVRQASLSLESIRVGEEAYLISIIRDITEQKRAIEALRESEERFSKAFWANPGVSAITRYDGAFLEVNPGFERIFGYTRAEALGKTPADLKLYINIEDRHRVRHLLETQGFVRNHEVNLQTKSGDIRYISLSIEPIIINNEQCLLTLIGDVTEQRQAEQALRRSEQLYRAIGESINYGIWVCDAEGRNIYASDSFLKLVGLTQEACSEFGWGSVLHPAEAEATMAAWQDCVRTGSFWEREHCFRGVDGQWHHLLARGVPIKDDEGEIICWAGINLDIDNFKQTEQALRESEERLRELNQTLEQRVAERTAELEYSLQELNQFTYVASHDLKTPLRGVKNLAGWIIEDAGHILPDSSRAHLVKLQSRVQRMEKLLNDLLTYSRLGRDYYQNIEVVDTGALVKEMVELMAPPAGFTITIQEPMPALTTYRILLEMVFKNLIENAIKHHHCPSGRVDINAREVDGFIEFTVTDDGPGIDLLFHERIFQIFQTLRPRDEVESTGAGLAIVKRAVESQGGVIKVISAEGEGATFRFTWPKY